MSKQDFERGKAQGAIIGYKLANDPKALLFAMFFFLGIAFLIWSVIL